jgi:hypothetical protein
MNISITTALLLNFSAIAGAMLARAPRYNLSPLSYQFGWLLLLVGAPAGLLAIYLFIESRGWGYGLLLWFGSAGLSHLLLIFLFEGMRTILGFVAAVVGFYLYFNM